MYGKFTLSGRQPGSGPQIVIIFVSGFNFSNFSHHFIDNLSSVNQNKITDASEISDSSICLDKLNSLWNFFL